MRVGLTRYASRILGVKLHCFQSHPVRKSSIRKHLSLTFRTWSQATNFPPFRPTRTLFGEAEIFGKAGVEQVFYSETLIGPRLPSLTYMLAFDSFGGAGTKVGYVPRVR